MNTHHDHRPQTDPYTIEHRDPADLRPSPLLRELHEDRREGDAWDAMLADIKERGIDQPLLVDEANHIIDGRRRWRMAKALQLTEVPVIVRRSAEAATLIVQSICQRRHLTKGQRAYLVAPLLTKLASEGRVRAVENLKKGKEFPTSPEGTSGSMRDLARQIGVNKNELSYAKTLHEAFAESDRKVGLWLDKHPECERGRCSEFPDAPIDYRSQFEPLIMHPDKPIGLGAAVAGIEGSRATRGLNRPEPDQLDLFRQTFTTFRVRFDYWQQFDAQTKQALIPEIKALVAAMPQDLRKAYAQALRDADGQ